MMVTIVVLVLATAAEYCPRTNAVVYVGVLAHHRWWGVSLLWVGIGFIPWVQQKLQIRYIVNFQR
jgi:hypothetical protein